MYLTNALNVSALEMPDRLMARIVFEMFVVKEVVFN
jgi:hypothetical protein